MGSFSIWHWLIVLLIIILVFGTRKLGNIGKDLGSAVHNFKKGIHGEEEETLTIAPPLEAKKAEQPKRPRTRTKKASS